MQHGWDASAKAWIAAQGDEGDFTRHYVLDPVMLGHVDACSPATALDVGCGEGRFCRMLDARGITTIGIDPTTALIEAARTRDPAGDYRIGRAEALDLPDSQVDLVVSYLSLIDIEGADTAIREMARVLRPGGTLLIANLNGFCTASADRGWKRDLVGRRRHYRLDRYAEVRAVDVAWKGIRITNWHRPISWYFQALLGAGLDLVAFEEPMPWGGPADTVRAYARVPYAHVMVWRKPDRTA